MKLDANKQLQLVDYFGAPNANWLWRRDLDVNTTPVAFDYRKRKFLVGTSKECRLWLLDREALGGEDHRTTLHTTPLICNDAQAFDAQGRLGRAERVAGRRRARSGCWCRSGDRSARRSRRRSSTARPTGGGVAAFKLEERAGKWQLTPAWLSRDMDLAEEAVIANGVVFAYAAGEDATQVVPDRAWDETGRRRSTAAASARARRAGCRRSRSAALYALDAPDRQGAVVERHPDRIVESLQRTDRRQRPRLHRDVRRRALLLRRRPVSGGS